MNVKIASVLENIAVGDLLEDFGGAQGIDFCLMP